LIKLSQTIIFVNGLEFFSHRKKGTKCFLTSFNKKAVKGMFSHVDCISRDAEPRSAEPVLSAGFSSGGFACVAL